MARVARPSSYPPPGDLSEYIAEPVAGPDERIEVGVLFVGGGPAGLVGAIRLGQLLQEHPELAESLGEVPIAVIDKGKTIGSHLLSGAVVNPKVLRELLPDVSLEELTSFGPVKKESVFVMTAKRSMRIPTPPPFHNKGNHVFSLSKLARDLAERAEALGVMILPETDAQKLLVKDDSVVGVTTGDKGLDRDGKPGPTFEPGAELWAKATVMCDGAQSLLTPAALQHFDLQGLDPQVYALGVKEIWKVAKPLDRVIHTMGWPLKPEPRYREFGGSFVYPMGDDTICIGFVSGLDYRDANLSVHDVLQQFKLHPRIAALIEGGERVAWGAKCIPEGGFFSLPASLSLPGALLAGDSAGMVNVPKLKGVHYAMRAGKLAAETIVDALKAGSDLSAVNALADYDRRVAESEIVKDLFRVRNMRQIFHYGFFVGGAIAGLMDLTRGWFPRSAPSNEPDAHQPMFLGRRNYPTPDGKVTFDKLSSVFVSGNRSRDDQPNHIRLQTRVPEIVAKTWVNMCPAAVYEIEGLADSDGRVEIKMAPSNCVQCGAITAKGGRLTVPEGGSGPEYTLM